MIRIYNTQLPNAMEQNPYWQHDIKTTQEISFYGTRWFINANIEAWNWNLSWARPISPQTNTTLNSFPVQYYPPIYVHVSKAVFIFKISGKEIWNLAPQRSLHPVLLRLWKAKIMHILNNCAFVSPSIFSTFPNTPQYMISLQGGNLRFTPMQDSQYELLGYNPTQSVES
jgi:hypothetical protein